MSENGYPTSENNPIPPQEGQPQWPSTPPVPPEERPNPDTAPQWQGTEPQDPWAAHPQNTANTSPYPQTPPPQDSWPTYPPDSGYATPYPQTPPPQWQDPNGAYPPPPPYGGGYGYDAPPPRRSKRPLFIALIAVAAILVTGITGVFAFKDQLMLRFRPELYFTQAVTKTGASLLATDDIFPDLAKFVGLPTQRELTFTLGEIPGLPYMNALEDSYFKIGTKTDLKSRRMLFELSFQIPEMQLNNNKLYLSEQMLGVELPALLPDYGMISVEPDSFVSRWNDSEYAYYLSEIPADFNLSEMLSGFFDSFEEMDFNAEEGAGPYAEYDQRLTELFSAFRDGAAFAHMGKTSLPSGDYQHFTLTFEKGSVKRMLVDFADLAMDLYLEGVLSAYPGREYLYDDMRYDMEMALAELEELDIPEDVTCHFYVDGSGRWTRFHMPAVQFSTPSHYGDERYEYAYGLTIDMNGEKNALDDLQVSMEFIDRDYGETGTIVLTGKTGLEGRVATSDWRLAVSSDSGYDNGEMTLRYAWDREAVSGDNFSLSLSYDDEYSPFDVTFTGNLLETQTSVVLSGGRMNMTADDETLGIDFGYTLREIDPAELDPANFSTTSLFDLSPTELMEALQTSIYALT